MLAADALTGSGGGHRGEPLSQQHVRAPRNGRVDFAAGISIGASCWVLSVALRSKLQVIVEIVAGGSHKIQQANYASC